MYSKNNIGSPIGMNSQTMVLGNQSPVQPYDKKKVFIFACVISMVFILIGVFIGFLLSNNFKNSQDNQNSEITTETPDTLENVEEDIPTGLDYTALSLGDGKYSNSPQVGYIYSCKSSFGGGGAFEQGPWIDADAGVWDLTQKINVDGSVDWPNAEWDISLDGQSRIFIGNALPTHKTGVFPIASTDDAYAYDKNPNSITEQQIQFELAANPNLLSDPECVTGQVGIMLTGVALYDGFDAGGRDAVATEIQDSCNGHPQQSGEYHYHGNSPCLEDESGGAEHSSLAGYALDGFGIFGKYGENGIELSTTDLDVCHGHTHEVEWDGENRSMYHYHLTEDFPYSVSCFRGKPERVQNVEQLNESAENGDDIQLPPPSTETNTSVPNRPK